MKPAFRVIALNRTEGENKGTATVELFGKTRELEAHWWRDGEKDAYVTVYGIALRYPTGSKVWHGSFTYWLSNGNINGIHTPMDHRARFASVSVVGFYADMPETSISQHGSRRKGKS